MSLPCIHQASRSNMFLVSEIPYLGNPIDCKPAHFISTNHILSFFTSEKLSISGLVHGSYERLVNYCEPLDPPAYPEYGNSQSDMTFLCLSGT